MADMLQFNNKTSKQPKSESDNGKSRRRYNSDEVADIIRVSLQQESQNSQSGIDHGELLSIGKEMGVNDEQIELAIGQLENEQLSKNKEQLLWSRFRLHAAIFTILNFFCFTINMLTGTDYFWFFWVIFGTGIPLALHYAGLRFAPDLISLAAKNSWPGNTWQGMQKPASETHFEDDVNVAFSVGDDSGLLESEGLVFIDGESLVIEHQTADAILGVFSTTIKDAEVPLSEIAHASLTQGFWSSQLIIQGRSLRTFRGLPGVSGGTMKLKIKKESRFAAEALVEQLVKRDTVNAEET